jgi:hypothetical protein
MSGSNVVFNIAKGRVVEKIADAGTVIGMVLLKVVDTDATLIDYDTVALMLAGTPDEADFTNYARKTSITGTITIDDTNNWVDVDVPDQTWTSAGGATNNTLVKLVTYYEESAADSGRVPMTAHSFDATTDGNDLIAQIAAAGFFRAT